MAELEEVVLPEDMTPEQKDSVLSYIENGLPGVTEAKSSDIFQWFELYMSGKTYNEIIEITNSKKDLVLYIAHKLKWHEQRMAHYDDMCSGLTKKLSQVKLSSANTMTTIVTALGKYYEKKFNKYLSQNDKAEIETLDTKLLSQYYKSLDTLEKLISEPGEGGPAKSGPSVHINTTGSVSVGKKNTEHIEITDDNAGEFLKKLAQAKKAAK